MLAFSGPLSRAFLLNLLQQKYNMPRLFRSLIFYMIALPFLSSLSQAEEPSYEEMVVTGEHRNEDVERFRTGQTGVLLSGDELRLQISNTLGETLATQPGVHNASFGPSVGLPVLRGLSGVRVRVIEDGIGSWDASSLSPDHAIAIEPALAESIAVLQGASTIEFGNSAVGGVVAVDTQRIPIKKIGQPMTGSIELRQELINDHQQTTTAGKFNAESESLGFHVDGFQRSHNDVEISGCAIDTEKVNEQFGFDASQSNTCGYIANSDAESSGFAVGTAITRQDWHVGISVREIDNEYGIPPGSHTEPRDGGAHLHVVGEQEEGDPLIRIDMEQQRVDLSAGYHFNQQYLKRLEVLVAQSDYEHTEAENGFAGTEFENDVTEAKLRLEHSLFDASEGVAGIQIIDRYFAATGSENFVPPSDIDGYGIYLLEKWQLSQWTLQAGVRADRIEIRQRELTAPLRPDNRQFNYDSISYDTSSFQLGLAYAFNKKHNFSASLGRHQRAPEVQELLSLGPHLATRSFDMGLLIRSKGKIPDAELFQTLDFSWEWKHLWGDTRWNLFYSEVSDFIYQANTGIFYDLAEQSFRANCVRLAECLPVYEYSQSDARLQGFEWQWQLPAWSLGVGEFGVDLFADYVKGTLHWVSIPHAVKAEVRLYDRLFNDEAPDSHPDKSFMDFINPNALKTIEAFVEPSLKEAKVGERFQFQRLGYFNVDDDASAEKLVFNKTVGLRDSWSKKKPQSNNQKQVAERSRSTQQQTERKAINMIQKFGKKYTNLPEEKQLKVKAEIQELAQNVPYEDLEPLFATAAKKAGTRIAAMLTLGVLLKNGLERNEAINAFISKALEDKNELLVAEAKSV